MDLPGTDVGNARDAPPLTHYEVMLIWHLKLSKLLFDKINSVEENHSSQCLALYKQYKCDELKISTTRCCLCPVFERTNGIKLNQDAYGKKQKATDIFI